MPTRRIGLIGTGRIGGAHLAAAKSLGDRVEVVAATNRTRAKAEAMREILPIARIHDDLDGLLADSAVEAVIVCLPFSEHARVTRRALQAGKHVLVEKPMAFSAAEAADMVATAESVGRTLMVAQSRRFSHAALRAHAMRGEIGEIFRIVTNFLVHFDAPPTGWWRDPAQAGDLIVPLQGSHYIDFALWFMGRPPDRVLARTRRLNPAFGAADEGDLLMEFGESASAAIHMSLSARRHVHETVIVGSAGMMRLEEYATGVPFGVGHRLTVNGEIILDGPQTPTLYTLQLAEFLDALDEGRVPLASGWEVLPVMEVIDAAARSQASGCVEPVSG